MTNGYEIKNNVIIINRDLTELDIFVKDFLAILQKYSDYLIVSGFVSIATGRTRATEDVDILVPLMPKEIFQQLFTELQQNGFWCYQGDTATVYSYLKNLISLRFARVNQMFPNIEFIPITSNMKTKYFEFTHPQRISIKDFNLNIPPIEFEIVYKEIVLAGDKDIADAKHLRTFFNDFLKKDKFKEYEIIIKGDLQ